MKHLPDFLVIGAEKGGTTWLHYQLKKHPEIFLPDTKEIHFFNKYDSNLKNRDFFKLGTNWYVDFFKKYKGQKVIGEVTPMYLCDALAPQRIKEMLPDVKLIAMLRNPVNRAYSHYNMAFNKKHTTLQFSEIIKNNDPRIIERGLYYQQLKKYFELFDEKQILVLFYEEVFSNTLAGLKTICNFLQVDDTFYDNDESIHEKIFESSGYKSAKLLNFQNYIVHRLRKNRITGKVLNWAKSKGVSDAVKNMNVEKKTYSKINEADLKNLNDYYEQDTHNLSLLLKRKLPYSL